MLPAPLPRAPSPKPCRTCYRAHGNHSAPLGRLHPVRSRKRGLTRALLFVIQAGAVEKGSVCSEAARTRSAESAIPLRGRGLSCGMAALVCGPHFNPTCSAVI
jgi:hypothetical protein